MKFRQQCGQALFLFALTATIFGTTYAAELTPLELFEQRIVPIFKSPEPSSCVQCHLSSVDLKDYILPSSVATFQSLVKQDLVNVDSPQDSKILELIAKGEQDPDKYAQRLNAKMRKAEYEAFSAWIAACCADKALLETTDDIAVAGPRVSDEVIRHSRKDRLLDSFVRNIWSQRMRCFPCHTPSEIDPTNPMHAKPTETYEGFLEQYGARMNLFEATPEASMRSMIVSSRKEHGDNLPLINVERPVESLLLLKPTAKVPGKDENGQPRDPSSALPVSHVGGLKMHKDDHSYKAFVMWLEDYAKTQSGSYQSSEELPEDNWFPTKHVLRIKGTPADWKAMKTVQVFVYALAAQEAKWQEAPIAFTQGLVTPRSMVNGPLFLLAGDGSDALNSEGETLVPGKYLVRVFVDHEDEIQTRPTLMLHDRQPDGEVEINATWGEGFKNAEVIAGADLH